MVKAAGMSLSYGAVGGLLIVPAIPGYFPFIILPILLSFIAYKSYTLGKCKYAFVIISACNFIVGNGLYFAPHADDNGLQGYALLVAISVNITSMIAIAYVNTLEENNGKID